MPGEPLSGTTLKRQESADSEGSLNRGSQIRMPPPPGLFPEKSSKRALIGFNYEGVQTVDLMALPVRKSSRPSKHIKVRMPKPASTIQELASVRQSDDIID